MEKCKKIAQFGAFDVNSFGDTLFPIALKFELEKRIGNVDISLFSPMGTDKPYGLKQKVYAIEEFDRVNDKKKFDYIVIGGGELLHFNPINFIGKNKNETYEKGYLWKRPIELAKFTNIPYILFGVGAPYEFEENEKIEIREYLRNAKYIGARDIYTYGRIKSVMPDCENLFLQPDNLWNINNYFNKKEEYVENKVIDRFVKDNEKKYLLVQYGTTFQYKEFAKEIYEVAHENNWKLVLMPINFCHEDVKVLEFIYEEICEEAYFFSDLLQSIDIVKLISNAAFFVGTSLHGNLVANVYGVKSLIIDMYGNFISKLDGSLYWQKRQQNIIVDVKSLKMSVLRVMVENENDDLIKNIQSKLDESYENISRIICGKSITCDESNVIDDMVNTKCYLSLMQKNVKSIVCFGNRIGEELKFSISVENKENFESMEILLPQNLARKIKCVSCIIDGKEMHVNKINFVNNTQICAYRIARLGIECNSFKNMELKLEIKESKKDCISKELFSEYNNLQIDKKLLENSLSAEIIKNNELESRVASVTRQMDDIIQKNKQELLNKQGHIELLLESERMLQRELNNMQNSRTWRVAVFVHKPIEWLFSTNSISRLIIKLIFRSIKHPIKSLGMLSPRKIRHFFTFLKEEGPEFVSKRVDESMQGVTIQEMQLKIEELNLEKPFENYVALEFVKYEKPMVSIVIPVYNQFAYTYHCLESILKNSGNKCTYEIIIANDCSTDDTIRLKEIIKNITVVTNEENLRFLKNCNNAAQFAQGKYILFLNNDTQVQENWLQPLVELIERDSTIGLVGSKLIYSNGKLQEAGGILWKDGSAWNYGNGCNPTAPEYNYVKETDYISGAAIMIQHELWNEIGGFDEHFAPAYYEDTDLAFEVRKHGYKVMYQPLSAVVHFEGISNGTDVNAGQKAYQVANQKKFYEKWKLVLDQDHFPNAENVFRAKDRSAKKKTLLMVDHYVPMYDKDAGSRCMFYYLQLFVKMGYNVKFIGDNFFKHEPYTTTLQQMGIEVLYGNYYYANWKDWIKRNGKQFDYVFLSRPHISIKYIDIVRENTNAKIIYFGHDLHYLREMREYELNGNEQALKDSKEWKKTELELMRKADVSYYLSSVELKEIAKVDSSIKVRRVPINIYSHIPDINYIAENRQGIIFVGGFGHPPNIDAVKWLGEEIMPMVWKKNPDITLHVVGSKPSQEIKDLANEHMIIHGFVSDEDLENLYKMVRLTIVPLRYGAGIKGKIIEAMMRGIPMVTTSIGIEGIEGAELIAKISDDTSELAEYILCLYDNETELKKMAEEEHQYIIDNYSVENAVETLKPDFDFE